MSLFTVTLILFLIMDPIGNISSFISLSNGLDPKRQRFVILREMGIALLIMLGFNYIGEFLFSFLDLSETTVRISSGVILFLIALKVLFSAGDSPRSHLPPGEPFIFPLAVPLISGPALLATILLFSRLEACQYTMPQAIFIAWLLAILILYFSLPIKKVLKHNGLVACERLIGMVLVLIAVQRILEGILTFYKSYPNIQ
jgi:multiple antibiotic resistance protein